MNFHTLDLNLLRVFDAVMAERNLTRAASRLALTQPAVSNALRRFKESVGEELLKAADAKNSQGLMDAGATMDQVCEGCHLKFWYPGQRIPRFPDEAPEVDIKQ